MKCSPSGVHVCVCMCWGGALFEGQWPGTDSSCRSWTVLSTPLNENHKLRRDRQSETSRAGCISYMSCLHKCRSICTIWSLDSQKPTQQILSGLYKYYVQQANINGTCRFSTGRRFLMHKNFFKQIPKHKKAL